jgi:hypothetical protein
MAGENAILVLKQLLAMLPSAYWCAILPNKHTDTSPCWATAWICLWYKHSSQMLATAYFQEPQQPVLLHFICTFHLSTNMHLFFIE